MEMERAIGLGQYQTLRLSGLKFFDYFFTPKTPSFAALATRNLTTVLAGILIFCCVFGLKPVRAFLFCFTSLPKPGKTNSPLSYANRPWWSYLTKISA